MEIDALVDLLINIIRNLLAFAGIYAVLWWCIDHITSSIEFAFKSISPYLMCKKPQSLDKQFGRWAIVTGSTDGIGKQLAMELARKGLSICLIARTESKLISTASEIGKIGANLINFKPLLIIEFENIHTIKSANLM